MHSTQADTTQHGPRRTRDLALLATFALWSTALPAAGATVAITSADTWLPWLRADGPWLAAWLFLGTALLTGLSLLPSHVAALICGYVGGGWIGTGVAVAGTAAGACLGYWLASCFLGDCVSRVVVGHPRAAAVHRALAEQSPRRRLLLVILLRLSPAMPFAATNLLMAAARVPFGLFQVGSTLGLLPRVMVVAWAGAGLAQLSSEGTPNAWLIALGVIATAVVLWVVGQGVRAALGRNSGGTS